MARKTDIRLRRSATSGAIPTTSQLNLGELAINTYDGKLFLKKDVSGTQSIVEIGSSAGQNTIWSEYEYTSTSNQTTFSGSDNNGNTLTYLTGAIQVFLNGVLQEPTTDYTATSGSSVVFVNALSSGEIVQIATFAKVIGTGDIGRNTYTGNGSTTAFTLGSDPEGENNLQVFIDGVYQEKSTFSQSGTTLTFSSAPANGTTIEVMIASRNVSLGNINDLTVGADLVLSSPSAQNSELTTLMINGSGVVGTRELAATAFAANTDSITEGSSNLYFTNERVDDRVDALLQAGTGITLTYNDSAGTLTIGGTAQYGDSDVESYLDANGTTFPDNVKSQYGASNDLQIYHDATDSYITNATGNIEIRNNTNDGDINFRSDNGSGGLTTYFSIDGGGEYNRFYKNAYLTDNIKALFGNSSDLQIYHDGSNSYIAEAGTGSLNIDTNGLGMSFRHTGSGSNKNMMQLTQYGATIHYDGSTRFTTNSAGVVVTGDLDNNGNADISGNLVVGGNLTVNGSTTTINSTTLDVDDLNITVAKGAADSAAANGAGLTIEGPTNNASMTWDHGNQYLEFNKDVFSGNIIVGTTGTKVGRLTNSSGVFNIEAYTTRQIAFGNADNGEHVRIDANGNVGIGTTSPSSKLHVDGHITLTDGDDIKSPDNFAIHDTGGSIDRFAFSTNNFFNVREGGYQRFTTRASGASLVETLRLQDNRVQINNSSSIDNNAQLHITGYSSGHAGITMQDVDVTNGKTFIKQTSGATEIQTQNGSSHGIFKITGWNGSAAAEFLRVNSAGNVGIGTTSPDRKLHVVGSGTTIAVKAEATDGNQSSLDLKNSEGWFRLINDGGSLYIYDQSDSAERFRINTSGQVGIGTSSPGHALDIRSAANIQLKLASTTSSNNSRMVFAPNNSEKWNIGVNISNNDFSFYDVDNSTTPVRFEDGAGSNTLVVADTSRVGINTVGPDTLLHVYHATDPTIRVEDSDSGMKVDLQSNGSVGFVGTTSNSDFAIRTNNTSRLHIENSGKVGIGTSSPSVGLDIGSFQDAIRVPNGTTAARPTGATGHLRYNTTLNEFEGYADGAWGKIGGGNAFGTIAVSGQSNLVADQELDTLTLVGQNGITITTNAGSDTVTIDGATSYTPFTTDLFTAGSNQTAYVLSETPSSEDHLIVFMEGVYQNKNSYTLSSATLTLDAAPATGSEVVVHQVGKVITGTSLTVDNFTGDGSTTAFTMSLDPMHENNISVYSDGVYQHKDQFTISGTTLTFGTAPLSGANLEVVIPQATEIQTPSTNSINAVSQYQETSIIPQSVTSTTVASTSATTIATHAAATYRTIKYLVQCTQGTDYHSTEINLIHDGTTVYITEYGTLYDNATLGTFDASISGGNILLKITAGSATSMAVKVVSTAIPV